MPSKLARHDQSEPADNATNGDSRKKAGTRKPGKRQADKKPTGKKSARKKSDRKKPVGKKLARKKETTPKKRASNKLIDKHPDDEKLADVVRRFEKWRDARIHIGRIPERLWASILALLPSYSTEELAEQFDIRLVSMQRRADAPPYGDGSMFARKGQATRPSWRVSISRPNQTRFELEVPLDDREKFADLLEQVWSIDEAGTKR